MTIPPCVWHHRCNMVKYFRSLGKDHLSRALIADNLWVNLRPNSISLKFFQGFMFVHLHELKSTTNLTIHVIQQNYSCECHRIPMPGISWNSGLICHTQIDLHEMIDLKIFYHFLMYSYRVSHTWGTLLSMQCGIISSPATSLNSCLSSLQFWKSLTKGER